ncbi:ferritin-like domain-containing protein [Agrobacterium fabrum]|uniref:ferritin-like domain-containing protein n=1 Tax=Agrobacterium fabrum TaxID=1176649 RepID=UPI003B9E4674
MPKLNAEPPVLTTMQTVLETASRMEQEAIDGYLALRQRMLDENQPSLAAVFERLIAEETSHLHQVETWAAETLPSVEAAAIDRPDLSPMFDAEGADLVPPETLDAYRAFSTAVRNEEKAFVFWSYVAAQAPAPDVQKAAERMAREELGHIATLRRERRQVFHAMRAAIPQEDVPDIIALEAHFLNVLKSMAEEQGNPTLIAFSQATMDRMRRLQETTFRRKPSLSGQLDMVLANPVTLCGILLDFYLDLINSEKNEEAMDFAADSASQLVRCLAFLRNLNPQAPEHIHHA